MDRSSLFLRFPLRYRIEHWVLAVNFTILATTGLVQLFPTSAFSHWLVGAFGGIEDVRRIHHVCAIILIIEALVHLGVTRYRAFMELTPSGITPGWRDAVDALKSFGYNLGIVKEKPKFGRYTFAEKAEYWAVIWGTIIMALTGFMMWNPIATTRFLPGQFIPAAKVAHGLEAVLAVLAIIVWHFYFVLIKRLNRSMFTGYVTKEEMEEEHPLELADIISGLPKVQYDPAGNFRFWRFCFPQYVIIASAILALAIWFAYFEQSSVGAVVPPENVTVFSPTTEGQEFRAPIYTGELNVRDIAWSTGIDDILQQNCAGCHGATASGGLDLRNYDTLMNAGVLVRGRPDLSLLTAKVEAGNHPGELSRYDFIQLHIWIAHGAPYNPDDAFRYLDASMPDEIPVDESVPAEGEPGTQETTIPSLTWQSGVGGIFNDSCGSCHGIMAIAGVNFSTYQSTMDSGVITPGNPLASKVIRKMDAGGHPGMFTARNLAIVRQWIQNGAPEGGPVSETPLAPPEEEETPAPAEEPSGVPIPVEPVTPTEPDTPETVPEPAEPIGAGEIPEMYWDPDIQPIFASRCTSCHGDNGIMGLDLRTYDSVMASGLVVAGDPDESGLIWKIEVVGHPGTLTTDELSSIRAWIWNGASENFVSRPTTGISGPPGESIPEVTATEQPPEPDEPPASEDGNATEEGPSEPVTTYTWDDDLAAILAASCGSCHGANAAGGLDVTSYSALMDAGVITSGNPDASSLVTKISDGTHFGRLTDEYLQMLRDWITSGAPEN